ncbi:MAG: hypothetical protein E7368_01625 [Clostridiales bacterium]|nr:hypothetical protein [Clostridiales bacterium]
MIISAVALWKKFNVKTPLNATEWDVEESKGYRYSSVSFSGHTVADGSVRISARLMYPLSEGKKPAVLLLGEAGKPLDEPLAKYFLEKGYAVLMPDYSGKMPDDTEETLRTVYPASLHYGNFVERQGYKHMEGLSADETCWFEWTYVALYCIEFLKSLSNIGNIGVVGLRTGGDIAWQTMLSPDLKCGVPINAVGWKSFSGVAKFGEGVARHLSDEQHSYIAGVEAQSYAPYVKCPVLMLCALRDYVFDCDRAYDTYSRIGFEDGNALVYSSSSGACIGEHALIDMELFLEKNLKGREIYIPETLNISLAETAEGIEITVECDKEGILEETGVYYAEADVNTKCAYRDWQRKFVQDGKAVKNSKATYLVKPFEGAKAVFAFAYAKYINGFRVMSKITTKRLSNPNPQAVKGRMLFSGKEMDSFSTAFYKKYAIGEIFLEKDAQPNQKTGYANIQGAYSIGGIKTFKIGSPAYIPEENAMLCFDVYFPQTEQLVVAVEVGEVDKDFERYVCSFEVKGGGKWKRIVLKAGDFKGEFSGMPLKNFFDGKSLAFDCATEGVEYSITNILWL